MRDLFPHDDFLSARTISVEPEKETQSPRRNVAGPTKSNRSGQVPTENTYSNGNNLSRSESSSSDSVNSQDGLIQVISRNNSTKSRVYIQELSFENPFEEIKNLCCYHSTTTKMLKNPYFLLRLPILAATCFTSAICQCKA